LHCEHLFAIVWAMTFGPASDHLVALNDVVARYCARAADPADEASVAADLLVKRSLINRLELDFARDAARFGPPTARTRTSTPARSPGCARTPT